MRLFRGVRTLVHSPEVEPVVADVTGDLSPVVLVLHQLVAHATQLELVAHHREEGLLFGVAGAATPACACLGRHHGGDCESGRDARDGW